MPTLTSISVYPLKSGRGLDLARCAVEARGLAGDRRFMAVDPDGRFLTGREHPTLTQIGASQEEPGQLTLTARDRDPMTVPVAAPGAAGPAVRIWGDSCPAVDAGDEAAAWLSAALATPARLVQMTPACARPVNPEFSRSGDEVSFADGYPLLLISEASLADLQSRIREPIAMRRFRPNLVVADCPAFAEDHWWRLRIGGVEFEGASGCSRCEFPTIDPDTGVRHPRREPMRTLSTYRRRPAGGVYFGQNLIPRGAGTIRVGDPVEIVT